MQTLLPEAPPTYAPEHDAGAPPTHCAEPTSAQPPSPATSDRARWERPALAALLGATALLYLWGLSESGWANSFYSAAAQAGSASWKAFFFGSSDAASSITVDKPPLSLWPMALSVRLFGLSSWSILAPQALMGVASVGVLYATVRRRAGALAALLAGAVLALTPVAVLMFRFNNPDALLVLLMTLAAATTMRAVEDGRTRWLVATGVLVGLGFLTKQLQVLLVVPGFALAWLVAGPVSLGRRIRGLLVAGGSLVVAAGWWIAAVELVPESWRPYIGGSQDNSILELTFGYNGLGRLTGEETGSVTGGGGGGNGGMWGQTGLGRLFDADNGGQIAWLVPAALMLLAASLWATRRRPRTDATRAALIAFGGWLVVTGLVFSTMGGIYHAYYTAALAPAVGALVGIGGHVVWQRRSHPLGAAALAAVTALTAWWSSTLLGRADWNPWLADVVLVGGLAAAGAVVAGSVLAHRDRSDATIGRKVVVGATIAAAMVGLAGPAAWAVQTAATPHSGAIVTAGPSTGGGFGPGGGVGPGGGGGTGGQLPGGGGAFPGGGQLPVVPGGGFPGGQPPTGGFPGGGQGPGTTATPGSPGGTGRGGPGGLLGATDPSDDVVDALLTDADAYRWVAATVGANNAAGYQLATEHSVMPIGGFNGTDPSPTLEQFQEWVAGGEIHWFIGGGLNGAGTNGGSDEAQRIAAWVEATFEPTTVDGVTLYDLSAGIDGVAS